MNRTLIFCILFFLVLGLAVTSCKDEEISPDYKDIPIVPVNFAIDPNSTQYLSLNVVNGSEYLTGGYQGIIVFRSSVSEFSAFERSCPYDWSKTSSRLVVDSSGITVRCPACNSKYILLDGTPYDGPSRYPLLQYQTSYDGNLLYIFN